MALPDFAAATVTVNYKDQPFTLKGFSLEDTVTLVGAHAADLEKVATLYVSSGNSLAVMFAGQSVMRNLMLDMPQVAYDIIALAAGERVGHQGVRQMPLPLAVNCLNAIFKLTFEDFGGPKEYFSIVLGLIGKSRSHRLAAFGTSVAN